MKRRLPLLAGLVAAVAVICAACMYVSKTPRGVTEHADMKAMHVPCKAHLYDGSVVLFPKGFSMGGGFFHGSGTRWSLDRAHSYPVSRLAVDSVACLEYFRHSLQIGPFLAGIAPVAVVAPLLFKALFGSCPTVYTLGGGDWTCEAECFSYSLAPWNERPDLDRLDYGEVVDGVYAIKLRNEALETHYVNSLALRVVDHPPGYEAFPDPNRKIVLFGRPSPFLSATDREGRDVLTQISTRDGRWWESDTSRIRELESGITRDWIDVRFHAPPGAQKMVAAFRLRNTLMTTVYLYDVTLGAQGVHALEWMDWGLTDLVRAWSQKDRYTDIFGVRIEPLSGYGNNESFSLGYAGPICWRLAAVELPAPEAGTAQLRFSSLPGNWAIDWIGISFDIGRDFTTVEYGPVHVSGNASTGSDSLAALLMKSDRRYLVTYPRDAYEIEFHPAPPPQGVARSYFIASSGYYIEWIRHDWFAGNHAADIAIYDEDIARTAALWLEKKESFEDQFFGTRLAEAGRIQP